MPIAYNKRTHRCGELRVAHIGDAVRLAGWVNNNRDHGGLTFVDLRDHTGLAQLQFNPERAADAHGVAKSLHYEDVIAVEGKVISRGDRSNPKLATGEIEIEVDRIDVLGRSDPLPFQVNDDFDANEDLCLRSRFLHLRRPEMQDIFRLIERVHHHPCHHRSDTMELILKGGDNAKVAATASNTPKQVCVLSSTGCPQLPIGRDDIDSEKVIDSQTILAGQPPPAAAQGDSSNTSSGDLTSRRR